MLDPNTWKMIDWPAEHPPLIVVVVDTEAEFDWVRQRPRQAMGVSSVKAQLQMQRIFERYEVRPTYVLDYPVSSTPEAYEIIRDFHRSGACEIGAHLQPWDNPPFVEPKTDENSYPGNLPFELEREKLIQLTRIIQENVGVQPRIYKAGRYGVGHSTARILTELGYEIDLSVVPGTDLSPQFGPDFSHCGVRPYWFGEVEALLEIPLSIGYAGLFAHSGARRHEALPGPNGSASIWPRTGSRRSTGLRKLARRSWSPVRACRDIAGKAGLPPKNARVELQRVAVGRPYSPRLQPAQPRMLVAAGRRVPAKAWFRSVRRRSCRQRHKRT